MKLVVPMKGMAGFASKQNFEAKNSIWLGNLPAGVTEEDLMGAGSQVGTPVQVQLLGRGKTARITFSNAQEAAGAIPLLNDAEFGDAKIQADRWTTATAGVPDKPKIQLSLGGGKKLGVQTASRDRTATGDLRVGPSNPMNTMMKMMQTKMSGQDQGGGDMMSMMKTMLTQFQAMQGGGSAGSAVQQAGKTRLVAGVGKANLVHQSPLFNKKGGALAAGDATANWKGKLNEILGKHLKRPLTKTDLAWDSLAGDNGFLTTLTLCCLEDQQVSGEWCQKKKDAEASAARAAVSAITGEAAPVMPRTNVMSWAGAGVSGAKVKKAKGKTTHKLVGVQKTGPDPVQEAIQMAKEWQSTRLMACTDASALQEEAANPTMDYWFGACCLLCTTTVAKVSWEGHARGQKHIGNIQKLMLIKCPHIERPPTMPMVELSPASMFLDLGGWGTMGAVLTVGEMDYSFSLSVAKQMPDPNQMVATSYLEEHDPNEHEVYPSDDGERAYYKRRTLPGMKGQLLKNLQEMTNLGASVGHGVDATQLHKTLRSQGCEGPFPIIVFPFPRASLIRAVDPRNSRLLREFFVSCKRDGFLAPGGTVQMVMLTNQLEEWDVNGMASDAGFQLTARAALPADFYQSREMSGKPWTPPNGELLCFKEG